MRSLPSVRYSRVEKAHIEKKPLSIDEMRLAVAMLSMRRYMDNLNHFVSNFDKRGTDDSHQGARAAVAEAIVFRLTQAQGDTVWHEVKTDRKYQVAFGILVDRYMDAFINSPEVLVHFIKSDEVLDLIDHIENSLDPISRVKERMSISPQDARREALTSLYALETDADTGETTRILPLEMKIAFMNVVERKDREEAAR